MRKNELYRRFGKRVFDASAAAVGLAVLALPMGCIALAVRLASGAPVFFRQRRVGKWGRIFTLMKFRTMVPNAESSGTVTVRGDGRITGVGRVLRRYKLDELPQLLNVLAGDMSLVGPRPDVPGYADALQGEDRVILDLKPGITGPATLAYRDEEVLLAGVHDPQRYNDEVVYPNKVALNLKYYHECSLWMDLRYILATVLPLSTPG